MIRTLVFDLDGTLADTAPDVVAAINRVLAAEQVDPLSLEEAWSFIGLGGRVLIERAFARVGRHINPEQREAFFEDFLRFYNANIVDQTQLFPGAQACLGRARARGQSLAICSNKREYSAKLVLEKLGVLKDFAFVCGQDTFSAQKPDPTPLWETLKRVGGSVDSAVMIGNSPTDVATARAAGVPVIVVDFGYSPVPVADMGADATISHFDALDDVLASL